MQHDNSSFTTSVADSVTDKAPLNQIIAEEKLNLALRNIDHNLSELTEKLRKPKEQAQYIADNWQTWKKHAVTGATVLVGFWLTRKIARKLS